MIDNKVNYWVDEFYSVGDTFTQDELKGRILNCIKDLNLVEADQWISVAHKLPEQGVEVVCWFSHEDFSGGGNIWQYMEICTYKDGVWWDEEGDDCNWEPSHWMLPKPPTR